MPSITDAATHTLIITRHFLPGTMIYTPLPLCCRFLLRRVLLLFYVAAAPYAGDVSLRYFDAAGERRFRLLPRLITLLSCCHSVIVFLRAPCRWRYFDVFCFALPRLRRVLRRFRRYVIAEAARFAAGSALERIDIAEVWHIATTEIDCQVEKKRCSRQQS